MYHSLGDGVFFALVGIIRHRGMKQDFCCLGDQVFLFLTPPLKS